jgi:hypothetical protein
MELQAGNGGWFRVDGLDSLPGVAYFRIQEVDGRLRITELYLDGRGEPIPPAGVRSLPVLALEQWAASIVATSDAARARLSHVGPDLSRLAAHFSTTFGKARHWVADSFKAQMEGFGVPQAPMPREHRKPAQLPPLALDSPPNGRLTDAFLGDVRRAYEASIARGLSPANTLATLASVSPKTIHSWVAKARDRGIMPPAERTGRIV